MAVVIYKRGEKPRRWCVRDTTKDFHTQFGVIPKKHLKPGAHQLHGHTFVVLPADFVDEYKTIKRKAQIITQKDIGYIVGYCCLGKDSVVLESGAGSGGATVLLARICKKVYSVELDEKNIAVVEENLKKLTLTNVSITQGDIYEKAPVTNVDMFLLDVPEPWHAYETMNAVKIGGYIVAYTPTIVQAQQFVNDLPEHFLHERTVELINRDWKIKGKAVRPGNTPIGHTAFLTFVRRLQ